MTDQTLKLSAATIGTAIADREPAASGQESLLRRLGRRFFRVFWRVTENYAKQANPDAFKHVL